MDEVETEMNGEGRILVRPSGTEPLVRVMVEASTDEDAQRLHSELLMKFNLKWA